MKLPQEFITRMQSLLGSELKEFLNTYEQERQYGFRVNRLKLSVQEYVELVGKPLQNIPWTKDGFYYKSNETPGKHPYYYAGLYYIQEPSAMAPAEVLSACPGDKVLDLCAAPGGKTMQIAADMKGKGVLVANEINPSRVKALVKNVELCGVKNAIVTNETPNNLSSKFVSYFDKILVDAPCSGEGMIRKDDNARRSWEIYNSIKCASMQRDILEQADIMLKPGGKMVYSTCTFSMEENEHIIDWFFKKFPNYELMEITKHSGIGEGISVVDSKSHMDRCARFWPHKVKGEGHFVAELKKKDGDESSYKSMDLKVDDKVQNAVGEFLRQYTNISVPERIVAYGDNVHAILSNFPDTTGINVVRTGWRLGSLERSLFEPYHSLIMGLLAEDIKNIVTFDVNTIEVNKYLKGETLFADCNDGWNAVCIGKFPLGWAKAKDGTIKNYYPKGWRKIV